MLTDSLAGDVAFRVTLRQRVAIFHRPVSLSSTYFYTGGRVYLKSPVGKKAFTSSLERAGSCRFPSYHPSPGPFCYPLVSGGWEVFSVHGRRV